MRALRTLASILVFGASAGLLVLAIDVLLVAGILGDLQTLVSSDYRVRYVAAGVAAALLVALALRVRGVPPVQPALVIAASIALLYAGPVFERAYQGTSHRLGAASVGAGLLCVLAYLGVAAALRRLCGAPFALLLVGVTVAAGLAANRNLMAHHFDLRSLAVNAALLGAAGLLALAARRFGPRAALNVLIAVVAIPGLGRLAWPAQRAEPVPQASAGERPNVVLVVIDTLRRDVFDAVLRETPEGREFLAAVGGAAQFTNAVAVAPWTPPSMASIMTGGYPPEHGFGLVVSGTEESLQRLGAESPTLAETLHAAGYATHAIVSNALLHPRTGIERGFEGYHYLMSPDAQLPFAAFLGWAGIAEAIGYLPAEVVRGELVRTLAALANEQRPVFLWIHLMDPHLPLRPHPDLPPDPAAEALEGFPRLYRGEVRYTLRELTKMLARIDEALSWERTALVLTADHGEMFPSDGHDVGVKRLRNSAEPKRYGHGHALYDELVSIPLLIRPPGGLEEPRRVDALVSHVDLFDTVLELAGVLRPELEIGRDRVGAAALLGPGGALGVRLRERALIGSTDPRSPEQIGVRTGRWKFIRYPRGERGDELYDLHADPGERNNLAGAMPERVAWGRRTLEEDVAALRPVGDLEAVEVDAATRDRLRALGYAE